MNGPQGWDTEAVAFAAALQAAQSRAILGNTCDGRQIVGYCPRCGKPILLRTPTAWKDGQPIDGIDTDPYHTCECWSRKP